MPSTAEVTKEYFDAVGRQDLEKMAELWAEGGSSRLVGLAELSAPGGVVEWSVPPAGSTADRAMAAAFNAKTTVATKIKSLHD